MIGSCDWAQLTWDARENHFLDVMIAQSVEHCTGIAEVMDSNPVQA